MRFIDKTPTSFELWIFKWIFLPIIGLGFMLYFVDVAFGKYECMNICEEKGFYGSNYLAKPPGKAGLITEEQCFCLTEEESGLLNKSGIGVKAY